MPGQPRFVEVEWDRGHESFVAIIVAEGADGMLFVPVHDLVPQPGFKWIARDEILSMNELDEHAAEVRLAAIRNIPAPTTAADLRSLTRLLQWALTTRTLVMVYQARTGSAEGLVGTVDALGDGGFTLRLVDTDGTWEHELETVAVDQVISLQWDDDYLHALTDLLADSASREPLRGRFRGSPLTGELISERIADNTRDERP